jgi:pyridoxine 5-phosphate synthase
LSRIIEKLKAAQIRISLFVDPNLSQILAAFEVGADIVEIHTGKYCLLSGLEQKVEFKKIQEASIYAFELGLEVHAGHGLDFKNAGKIARIEQIAELNIGHFLISEAIFSGLAEAILKMKKLIN